jgi:hypothetical protein
MRIRRNPQPGDDMTTNALADRRVGWGLGLAVAILMLVAPGRARDPVRVDIGSNSITLATPGDWTLRRDSRTDAQLRAWWWGRVGASRIRIEVRAFPASRFDAHDPGDVEVLVERNLAEKAGDPSFRWSEREGLRGPFGRTGTAVLATGSVPGPGEILVLGGVLEEHAYAVSLRAVPPLEGKRREAALAFLRKGVVAACPAEDPRWSEDEARSRWREVAGDADLARALRRPVRTDHYIVLTNSSAGKLFARKMEECYRRIRKAFPFEEPEEPRLLPVYLFRTEAQYQTFCASMGWSPEARAASKGHAWKDYYATYYSSPNDPVHIHEATHQVFSRRLRRSGGGSWFQEGVAEYMCTSRNERRAFARRAARSGEYVPFREFVRIEKLIDPPMLDGRRCYLQAASIIEFLKDGRWQRAKFPEFVDRVGRVRRDDPAAIEAAVKAVYGVGLDGLEKAWVKHWR